MDAHLQPVVTMDGKAMKEKRLVASTESKLAHLLARREQLEAVASNLPAGVDSYLVVVGTCL